MAITKAQAARLERVKASPRYADGVFKNTHLGKQKSPGFGVFGEYFTGKQLRSPPAPLPSVSPLPAWSTPPETGLRLTWLGHSTVLVELDGVRILTDPVWGDRASPIQWAGPKRFQPVPVSIAQLPKLDAVIVSHDHYDHLDRAAVSQLSKRDVPFFTSLGVGAHLEGFGVDPLNITELDWWDTVTVPDSEVTLTAAPSQHFSGRGVGDRNATLWSSFAMKGPRHSVFFSGDTGLTQEYAEIRKRLGPFDVSMLEVGAFHESWGDIHLGPRNALEAHALLGAGLLLPVHWGTFNLALHAWDEPAETLVTLAEQQRARLLMPKLGAATEPKRVEALEPWWRGVKTSDAGVLQYSGGTPPVLR